MADTPLETLDRAIALDNATHYGKSTLRRILVIEDEAILQKTLSMRLKKLGFDVVTIGDGERGLQEAKRSLPDLIVLDLRLPGLPGEAICASIREQDDERIAAIPIIMVTGKTGEADRILGKVVGADAYLTKPFAFEELRKEIYRLI